MIKSRAKVFSGASTSCLEAVMIVNWHTAGKPGLKGLERLSTSADAASQQMVAEICRAVYIVVM